MKLNKNKVCSWLVSACVVGMSISCQPEEFGDGNGLGEAPGAAFTVTPVAGEINKYLLEAETEGVLGVKWDLGDGAGASMGNTIDTVFYPDAGEYTITLTALGRGGLTSNASNEIDVLTSDPNAGNLVLGGKMSDGDDSHWEFVTYSAGVNVSMVDGKMVWTGGGWGHAGIYQEIEVVGG